MSEPELDPIIIGLEELLALELLSFAGTLRKEIATMRIAGMADEAIYQVLLNDAEMGGKIFGSFANSIKSQMYGTITKSSVAGKEAYFRAEGIDTKLERWMTVSKTPCPDCSSRAGRVETKEYWEAVGIEGSGWSVCGRHCQCQRVPVESNTPDEIRLE